MTTIKPDMTKGGDGSPSTATTDFASDVGARNIREVAAAYRNRLRGGDVGALPALFGVIVLVIAFTNVSSLFLSKGNFANLIVQMAPVAILAMGLIFVLLLGEIDLSAGTASGVCAATMALALNDKQGLLHRIGGPTFWVLILIMAGSAAIAGYYRIWPATALIVVGIVFLISNIATKNQVAAIVSAIAVGSSIGSLIGFLVARVNIPSFVVTLALFLAWQGVILQMVGQGATESLQRYNLIIRLENKNISPILGWLLWAVAVGAYLAYTAYRSIKRRAANLTAEPLDWVLVRGGLLALGTGIAVFVLNLDRSTTVFTKIQGVPIIVPIIGVLFVGWTLFLSKTKNGRYIYAVGGNAEAARRASIDVVRVRLMAFTIGSSMAGAAGVIAASRQGGVDLGFGGGTVLLYAVAAAVIGGTSLFGGKGKVRDAVIGALIIAMIPNGLGYIRNVKPSYEFLLAAAVLLLAASVDALSRKRSTR
jgi:D-xylose transport system permease protein